VTDRIKGLTAPLLLRKAGRARERPKQHPSQLPQQATSSSGGRLCREARIMKRARRERSVTVSGVLFLATGDGHYRSKCGRWAIYHVMRGTRDEQWELYTCAPSNDMDDLIDSGIRLADILAHAERGVFILERA
jgi:hypothetical protein